MADIIDEEFFPKEFILSCTSINDLTPIQAEMAFMILTTRKDMNQSCILTILAKESVTIKTEKDTYWIYPDGTIKDRGPNSSKYSREIDVSDPDFISKL